MMILILAATEINRDVEQISQKWENMAAKPITKEVQAFVDELNANTDCCTTTTKTFTRNPLTNENYEEKNQTGSKIAGTSSSDDAQKEQNKIIIFMSYSVPKPVWQKLKDEAKTLKQPIQFVLRGLPCNSFQELAKKVMEYKCQVSIDPPLFERYGITAVPAFLIKQKGIFVKNNSDKKDHNPYQAPVKGQKPGQETIFFGNVSLSFVVEKMAKTTTHKESLQRTSTAVQFPKEIRS